jgi:methyl-accepting chemotaxis protein
VNENVTQSSQVSDEIAKDIGHVTKAAGDVSNRCADINDSSQELARLAEMLNEMVRKFKV